MENEIDTQTGGEPLTLDQGVAAYVKATAEPVSDDHGDTEEQGESDTTTDEELQEGDEPESEETDGTAEDGDETATEEDAESETAGGRFAADNANVRLSDGSVIPVSELKAGYLKNGDATRKWQEAAEIRRTAEAQSATFKASQDKLNEQTEYVTSLIRSILPEPPDPSRADPRSPNYDPAGYQADEVQYRAWAQHLQALEQQQFQRKQETTDAAAKAEKEKADTEWATLIDKLPHLKDEKRVDPFVADLRKTASTYGFKPEELKAIALDHRLALALNDASKWQKLQATKAKAPPKVENRPPVVKGGKRLTPQEHQARAASDARAKLQQTGRLDDAVALLLATQK